MLYSEDDAIALIKTKIESVTSKDERDFELFVADRERINPLTYKATLTARFGFEGTDAEFLTKEFMKLFIQNQKISFERNYPAVVVEKGLRVIDFIFSAEITITPKREP